MPLPTLFPRWYGPIPPIKAIRDQAGDWANVGETRTIVLGGGGTMREELTAVDAPNLFGYVISEVTGPLALLVDHIDGSWIFSPHDTGTTVTWRWTLHPKSALALPAVWVFARVWKGYARNALQSLSNYLAG